MTYYCLSGITRGFPAPKMVTAPSLYIDNRAKLVTNEALANGVGVIFLLGVASPVGHPC